jgi:DNA-binding LacI/PurR family transcriptional regulator
MRTDAEAAMIAAARHDAILRELELRGSVTVAALAARLGVSAMTLRRDLAALEARALLVRVHGGAVPTGAARQRERHPGRTGRRTRRPVATIGMIVPTAGYYFPQVIRGAGDAARDLGCRLVLGTTHHSAREELRQVERLVAHGVDGLLITAHGSLADGAPLRTVLDEAPMPVVVVERAVDEAGAGRLEWVRSDHAYGAEVAVRHLAELGHRHIALAARETPTTAALVEGFEHATARLGLRDRAFVRRLPTPGVGEDVTTEEIGAFVDACVERGVTAALVLSDVDAMATVESAIERGLGIPEDFALVAYDDEFSDLATVPLTAVAPPKHDLGYAALRLCVDHLRDTERGSRAVTRMTMLPVLVERASTRPRPA